MGPNDADGMANSVNPDQTAPVCPKNLDHYGTFELIESRVWAPWGKKGSFIS